MALSVILAQRFFRVQYQKEASSALQLWQHYGPEAISGCQLWDNQLIFKDNIYSKQSSNFIDDWSDFVQDYRKDSLYRQHFAQFFSPISAIKHVLQELPDDKDNYLDPSCGAGCFLIQLWNQLEDKGESAKIIASKLYGVDLDPDLVALTRFRLFQKSKWNAQIGKIIENNIQAGDSLLYTKNKIQPPAEFHPINWTLRFPEIFDTQDNPSGFQAIVGNPPFLFLSGRGSPVKKLQNNGKFKEANQLEKRLKLYKKLHPEAAKGCADLYKYFIHMCTEILAPKGAMGLILPSSWIRLSRYEDIRQILIKNGLYRIEEFGQKHFPLLVVPSSIIFCGKLVQRIQYIDHQNNLQISIPKQSPFALYRNPLVGKIFSQADCTLGDICTIREGLHDYSHKKGETRMIGNFLLSSLRAFQKPSIEMIPIPQKLNSYLHSGPRILLRKTGDSLIGALIQDASCCLTHQNCYVLHTENDFSPKALEILINSRLLTYFYQNSPSGQKGRVMAQLRIWGLKKLPLPKALSEPKIQLQLIQAHLENRSESFLINLFTLSPKEKKELREAISNSHLVNQMGDLR